MSLLVLRVLYVLFASPVQPCREKPQPCEEDQVAEMVSV
jgi:hypothetical protein